MQRLILFFIGLILFAYKTSYGNTYVNSQNKPVYIEYNDLFYNDADEVIIFKGDVIVVQGNEVLTAEEMHYHKAEDKYYAKGNIAILKEDGSVYFADILNLDRFLYKGRALNFKGRLTENGLISASEVEIFSKTKMQMGNVVFSTCRICENNLFPNIPLWQIRAKEALIDRDKESITYKHARLEAFGTPIAYTPYIVTPTPGAKRKSGFLSPNFAWTNDFGYSIRTPYYWNIAPNMDATTSVRLFTKDQPLLEGNFRHLTDHGEYLLEGSMINTKKVLKDGTVVENSKQVRGHINFESLFTLENTMFDSYIGLNLMRVYDKSKTYLKKYKISQEDILTTNGFVRNFWDNNYLFLDTLYFQNLNTAYTDADWKTAPRIVPWLRGYFDKDLEYNNSKIYFDIDALNLHRNTGLKYQRLSSTVGYKVPFVLPYGQLLQIGGSLRGDYYQVHQSNNSKKVTGDKPVGSTTIAYPQFDIEWRLPLINHTNFGTITLEPIANLIIARDHKPSHIIPNEDSQFFEISALNLVSNNRYLGHDRLETGSRLNYGLRGNLKSKYIENLGFTAGEVINFKKHENYGKASGLMEKRSDYVSKVYLQPIKEVYLVHKLRLDNKDLSVMRNEVYTSLNLPEWNMSINYMEVGKKILTYNNQHNKIYRKDITSTASYNIYNDWWLGGYVKRKLGGKIPGASKKISEGVNLNYLGDCLQTFFIVERDHTKLNDLKPSTTYALNVKIPGF